MKIANKMLCVVISLVMLLSLISPSVYAATEYNGESGNSSSTVKSHSWNGIGNMTGYTGMRFSLYFAEGNWETIDDYKANPPSDSSWRQIGKTVEMVENNNGGTAIKYASGLSVFDRMINNNMGENGDDRFEEVSNYNSNRKTIGDFGFKGSFPKIFGDGLSSDRFQKFFMGSINPDGDSKYWDEVVEPNKLWESEFVNIKKVIDKIVENTDYEINEDAFAHGYYYLFGKPYYGIFKLYFEPLQGFVVGSDTYGVGSARDFIAMDNASPSTKITHNITSAIKNVGNAVWLTKDEPQINMTGRTAGSSSYGNNDVVDKISDSSSSYYKSAGVGVITGFPMGKRAIPDVVKTYVSIQSVDANGKMTYAKAGETTKETAEFYLDGNGNVTQIPLFETLDGSDNGLAILNDIVSVDEDLTITDNSEWVNTSLPVNVGTDLKPTAEDVAGYIFGIVTGSETFIDQYNISVSNGYSGNEAGYHALSEIIKMVQNKEKVGATLQEIKITSLYFVGTQAKVSGVLVYGADEYEYFEDIKLGRLTEDNNGNVSVQKVSKEEASSLGIMTPANTLILRYIVKPTPSQINVIEIVDQATNTTTYVNGGIQALDITGTTARVQNPDVSGLDQLGTPELVEWVTNQEYPTKDISNGTLPEMSPNGKRGSDKTITDYPMEPATHNLYVKWRIVKVTPPKEEGKYFVPEWRLSRYFTDDLIPDGVASMSLPITYGHCGLARLSPSGIWNYTTRNPNGKVTQPNHSDMKFLDWIHAETIKRGSSSVGAYNPTAIVSIDGVFNAIKSTNSSNLKVVNWLDQGSINGLKAYDVSADSKGTLGTQNRYSLNTVLPYNTLNLDTYTNTWPSARYTRYGHYHVWDGSKTISPYGASYSPYNFNAEVDFARYIAQAKNKMIVPSNVKTENGKTTVAYQVADELNVYPEIAMLFDNDSNNSSIKWAVGEQARVISPVIFHTLQFKLFVTESSIGTSVATDTRALAKARALGQSGKQTIYKGAGVNTAFTVGRSESNMNHNGILTVKTFALDITENKNSVNLKKEWGADKYDTLAIHDNFINHWMFDRGVATERLEIDGLASTYMGADVRHQNVALAINNYGTNASPKTVISYEHRLIIRGGEVVGVELQDRGTLQYSTVQLKDLQSKDVGLYEALEGMKLIGANKDATVLTVFEHQTGASLTEQKYIDLVKSAKRSLDGFETNNISLNKGWYSEDATTLVIREYVTNYSVPSQSFSDKISMSVKGLETPINKNDFFSKMGLGHTFINYTYKTMDMKDIKNDLPTNIEVFFEHTSREKNEFGNVTTDYLVPNVSITDTTRQ